MLAAHAAQSLMPCRWNDRSNHILGLFRRVAVQAALDSEVLSAPALLNPIPDPFNVAVHLFSV
jgi:hypothetical protein